MDPICHTLVGASLAQTGLGKKSAFATAALVLGANLPDVDGAALLLGSDDALLLRRGWTHGIPAVVLLPLLLTGFLVLWHRAVGNRGTMRPGALLGLSYLAVATHPTLDWMNNYGMRWLMPLEGRWFYGDTLFIVDPWMWLVLGGAVFLYRSRRASSIAGWALFAAFAGALLFYISGLVLAKALWLAGVATLVAMRVRGLGASESAARRMALGAVAAATLYVVSMLALAHHARGEVEAELRARGIQTEALMVAPVAVTPFRREVVLRTPEGYRYGAASLLPRFELDLAREVLPLPETSPLVEDAMRTPSVRGFANWARFPFGQVEPAGTGFVVTLLDARYMRRLGGGFGTARVAVP